MWLKPVKSFSSELAYGVAHDTQFRAAFDAVRACLAEEALTGNQVAVEGYVHDGEVTVNGVLDSHCYPGRSSFLRHQYPAALPAHVEEHLADICRRVITRIGLEAVTYSVEFFHRRAYERYDSVADHLASVAGESTWTMSFHRGDWDARTVPRDHL